MLSKPGTVNWDMDGVMADFTGCMARELGRDMPEAGQWNLERAWGLEPGEFAEAFVTGVMEGRVFHPDHTDAYGDALLAVRTVASAGWSTRIVTALGEDLPPEARAVAIRSKLLFLTEHRVPFDELHFTRGEKAHVRADAVVDDHPVCRRWAQPGARNFLLARPWNMVYDEAGLLAHVRRTDLAAVVGALTS